MISKEKLTSIIIFGLVCCVVVGMWASYEKGVFDGTSAERQILLKQQDVAITELNVLHQDELQIYQDNLQIEKEDKQYYYQLLLEKKEDTKELYETYYYCYWAYNCTVEPAYCEEVEIRTAKAYCELSPKYSEWMEMYWED